MYKFIQIQDHIINIVQISTIEKNDLIWDAEEYGSHEMTNSFELYIRTTNDSTTLRYDVKEDRDKDFESILNVIKPLQI